MKQLKNMEALVVGAGHWTVGKDGHVHAAGTSAINSIAHENGGTLPTELGKGADGILLSTSCASLGSLFGPAGAAAGVAIGQVYTVLKQTAA